MPLHPKYEENEFDSRIERFDASWETGVIPAISDYLLSDEAEPRIERRIDLAAELVMIDLEYRWRRVVQRSSETTKTADRPDESKHPIPARPIIEDYFAPFPELLDGKLTKLIASEYHTRHRWGDRPAHDEYLRRFPDQARAIADALRRVDQRLPQSFQSERLRVRCPHCHVLIDSTALDLKGEIECTSCHGEFNLVRDELNSGRIGPGGKLGSFQLHEQLGSGSFGTVWKARDTQLDRDVAIKIPHRETLELEQVEQFLREARTAAQLNHPNIVSVHEVGRDGGIVFVVSDLIDGTPLSEWMKNQSLSSREVASLCETIARALDHAHQAGVIHRDLKPSNIIMDSSGQPHLTDFGLARREMCDVTLTRDGQLLGTPAYMSPEQARGEAHRADRRSDIYSAGVILFELLTGEHPFRGNMQMLLRQIVDEDAPSLRKLNSTIPQDLETICLKCLEKEPGSRFRDASELAEELQRFLERRPIHARPITRVTRVWRWCSRNPLTSTLTAMLTLAIVCGFIVVTYLWISTSKARDLERRRSVSLAFNRGLDLCQQGNVKHGMLWLARSLELDQPSQELSRVIRTNMAVWGADCFPLVTILPHHGNVTGRAISPDGKKLLTRTSDGIVRLWDAVSGKLIGQPMVGQPMIHDDWVGSVAFSPDGKTILTASGTAAHLWNSQTGKRIGPSLSHNHDVWAVAYSSDGESIVTGSKGGKVQLWDAKTHERIGPSLEHDSPVKSVDFSPNGAAILSCTNDRTIRLWDLNTRTCLSVLPNTGELYEVAFSPDGSYFATSSQTNFTIWETATRSRAHDLRGHAGRVVSFAFSPNGQWIVGGCGDAKTRIWEVSTGRFVQEISTLAGEIEATAFSRDGSRLFVGSTDHAGLLYDATRSPYSGAVFQHTTPVWGVEFVPEGKAIVTGSNDGIRSWDLASRQSANQTSTHDVYKESVGIAFPRDGKIMAVSHGAGLCAQLWKMPALNPVGPPMRHAGWVGLVDFKPDGSLVLTACHDGKARLWDTATGRLIKELPHADTVRAVAFGPNGRKFLTGGVDKIAHLWDADTYKRIGNPMQHQGVVLDAKFSPDGQFFATASSAGMVWLWDASTQRRVRGLQHNTRVRCVSFSPNGRFLAAGCEDGEIRFWDTASGQPIALPRRHHKRVSDVPFSPDGAQIASASWDGTVRLWDAPPPPIKADVKRIVLWTQVLTAQELEQTGLVRFLDRETWLNRRAQLQALGGPPIR